MVKELKTIAMGFSDYIIALQKEFSWLCQGKEQGLERRNLYQKLLIPYKHFPMALFFFWFFCLYIPIKHFILSYRKTDS